MRLIQIRKGEIRRVALVEEPNLRLLDRCSSIFELAKLALADGVTLGELVRKRVTGEVLPYDPVYAAGSEWRILPAIDHPHEPARCLVSGTGLTHLGSARDRQAMHETGAEELTDSMRMFRWGLEGGRPAAGRAGTAPEWFYKGTGTILRAHGEPLEIPSYAEDGGEEAEIAGVYIIAPDGRPCRIGMAAGNEFSDHQFERKNYLNLAGSKLRTCALGPELVVEPRFESVQVAVKIERAATLLWSRTFRSGEAEMCHSLQNIEHHHFKFEVHRRPDDVHVHFLGTDCLSFSEGVQLREGDVMEVLADGFGRALRNPVHFAGRETTLVQVVPLRE
ncbi:MAG TPA: AraD1 family protein [Terriglobales bacterium]|nr:AraD1 family protein [Terriglobales bacterium]